MTEFPIEMLHRFCPMHAVLDKTGHIIQAGPTLHKIGNDNLDGKKFLDIFEIYRPRSVMGMQDLIKSEGRKLHLRLRGGVRTPLKGVLSSNGRGRGGDQPVLGFFGVGGGRGLGVDQHRFCPNGFGC